MICTFYGTFDGRGTLLSFVIKFWFIELLKNTRFMYILRNQVYSILFDSMSGDHLRDRFRNEDILFNQSKEPEQPL